MVGTSTNDSDIDSITFIPTSITINNVNSVSRIQIIDSSFTVDFPGLYHETRDVSDARDSNAGCDKKRACGRFPKTATDVMLQG